MAYQARQKKILDWESQDVATVDFGAGAADCCSCKSGAQGTGRLARYVPDEDLGEPPAARGEHNPTAAFALDPLSPDDPAVAALQQALGALQPGARSELFVLMRMGQGDLGINDRDRGLSEAELLGDQTVTAAMIENLDLHDHVTKGLYEITPSS